MKQRASRRRIAEMSFLCRGLLDELATVGGLKARAHHDALDLVDAFVRGEPPKPEAIAAARAAMAKVSGRLGVGGPPLFVALSNVPIELVFRMMESGDDLSKYVRSNAIGAIPGPPESAAPRVEELFVKAQARAASIDDGGIPTPPHEVAVDTRVETLDLPAIAIAHLVARGAARTGKHADEAATRALLGSCGLAAHPSVLAFEASYGGLELFESDPDAPALVVGPYAYLSASPGYEGRKRDHVPVAFAWNDVYYALDARGRGFTNASMVEGVFRPSAPNGRALLTQAILWRALETHPASFSTHEGREGAALAKARALPAIEDAAGKTERWWGDADGMRLVVEIDRGNGFDRPMTFATGRADRGT